MNIGILYINYSQRSLSTSFGKYIVTGMHDFLEWLQCAVETQQIELDPVCSHDFLVSTGKNKDP